jgi:NAD(P)-dependent dehydrogenase (short-subunit alcohol dehydrogenase family)
MVIAPGNTAVVTGAANGIGRALCERFAAGGMRVVLADRDAERLAEVDAALTAAGADVLAVPTDVGDQAAVEQLADRTRERFGDVHLLCNNAGVVRSAPVWSQTLDDLHSVFSANFWGVVHGIRAFVPGMISHGRPAHVVNTASFAGLRPLPMYSAYSASKFAVVGLSESLRLDLAAEGHDHIGVSVVCPGGVETNIFVAEAQRRRQRPEGEHDEDFARLADVNRKGRYLPSTVADAMIEAVRHGTFYVIPAQPELRPLLEQRMAELAGALHTLADLPVTT